MGIIIQAFLFFLFAFLFVCILCMPLMCSKSLSYLSMGICTPAFSFFPLPSSFLCIRCTFPSYVYQEFKLTHYECLTTKAFSSFPLLLCVFSVQLHLMCIKCVKYITMGIYWSFLILSTSLVLVGAFLCTFTSHVYHVFKLSQYGSLPKLSQSFYFPLCVHFVYIYISCVSSVQAISL